MCTFVRVLRVRERPRLTDPIRIHGETHAGGLVDIVRHLDAYLRADVVRRRQASREILVGDLVLELVYHTVALVQLVGLCLCRCTVK